MAIPNSGRSLDECIDLLKARSSHAIPDEDG
jgi:hypothetical protein